jgi:hypothetical protein
MPAGLLTNSEEYRKFLLGRNLPDPVPDEIRKGNYQPYYQQIGKVFRFPNPANPEYVRFSPETLEVDGEDRMNVLVNLNKYIPENGYQKVDIHDSESSLSSSLTNRLPYTKQNFELIFNSGGIGIENPLTVIQGDELTNEKESRLAIESKKYLEEHINIKKSTYAEFTKAGVGITNYNLEGTPEDQYLNFINQNITRTSTISQAAIGWQEYGNIPNGDEKVRSILKNIGVPGNTQLSTEERVKSLLEFTNSETKEHIFKSLSYNKYKPSYITDDDTGVLGESPPNANYYIGDERSTNLKPDGVFTDRNSDEFNDSETDKTLLTTTPDDFTWTKEDNNFNPKTILHKTQELVNNDSDKAFVNLTDKFFKDNATGKYISRGNAILSDEDDPTSFCRVWTTEDPYSYENAIRRRGLDSPFGLNILGKAHLSVLGKNGMVKTHPTALDRISNYKKYMLSLENLAWADNFSDLPECEQGPGDQISGNRGRIMWFAPYDLQFDENVNANFTPTEFLGRGEPVFTYNNTRRSGQLRFKLLVDHPAVINAYRGRKDKLLEQFFAGCKDIEDINDYIKGLKTISKATKRAIETKMNSGKRQKVNSVTDGTSPNDIGADDLSNKQKFANIVGNIAEDILTIDECDMFDVIDDTYPTYFDGISERIKYFHPSFHSTTPESFNKRLNFLHQCTRQGPSVYSSGDDIKPQNLAFGRPPVCILRIGDFFYSKVIINSLSISFAGGGGSPQWDLNPEGIGVQPMIADVNLSIDIIGGQSLNGPINRLQNALSFNFYANTEFYDERADTITLDGSGTIKDGAKPNQAPETSSSNQTSTDTELKNNQEKDQTAKNQSNNSNTSES